MTEKHSFGCIAGLHDMSKTQVYQSLKEVTETDSVIPLEEIGKMGTVKVYNQAYVDKLVKQIEELKNRNAELKGKYAYAFREAETYKQFCAERDKQIAYAKSIIQNLLDNSDEYAEQRARDFLNEQKGAD